MMKVHENQPVGFIPTLKVCGALIQHDEKFLLLKRHPNKSHGNHWNLPAGKLEAQETTIEAALREVHEESGIRLSLDKVHFLGVLYFECSEINFEFHIYYSSLGEKPQLSLSEQETIEGKWWNWHETIEPLIPGGQEVLNFCKRKIALINYGQTDKHFF